MNNSFQRLVEHFSKFPKIKVTTLGRGLSSGSELEYVDSVTLEESIRRRT